MVPCPPEHSDRSWPISPKPPALSRSHEGGWEPCIWVVRVSGVQGSGLQQVHDGRVPLSRTEPYRSPHSPFYQLPPGAQRLPPNPLLTAPTPPALQKLLGELLGWEHLGARRAAGAPSVPEAVAVATLAPCLAQDCPAAMGKAHGGPGAGLAALGSGGPVP